METILEVEIRNQQGADFIYMRLGGTPNRQALNEYNERIAALYSSLVNVSQIDVVADITQLKDVPTDFIGIGKKSPVINPKTRRLLIAGESNFLKALSSVIFKLIRWNKVTYFTSLDAAYAQIQAPAMSATV